jgi:hypothetical protein
VVCQQQNGHCGRGDAASDVGREHDSLPREPVGPDAGDEEQRDAGDRPCREHVCERRRRLLDREHRERQADHAKAVAEVRDDAAEPEKPELALLERT